MKSAGFMGQTPKRYFALPDHLKLNMPNLSPTMEKGNIGEYSKAVGDTIVPGDVLCSIETDKAAVDFEMQDEGFVARIFYPAGTKDIPLGKCLAIVCEEEEDIPKFANMTIEEADGAGVLAEATPIPIPVMPTSAAPVAAAPTPSPAAAPAK